jgi:hypothetical protein
MFKSKKDIVVRSAVPPNPFDGFQEVHEWPAMSSDDKEALIRRVEGIVEGNDEAHAFLRQCAALMVDEMLENALYSAPRDFNDNQIYSKGEKRSLSANEKIVLRCAFDGEKLFLEVSDSWGKLSPATAQRFIALNLAQDVATDRAGRGLFLMWNFMKDFYVNLVPNLKTSVGGYLLLNPNPNEYGAN